jgi:hypothetical protein
VRRRHASHKTVVLRKAAHSGPSVCLRARAPCPLRVSCPGTDRAERAAQAAGVSVQCKLQVLALPCLPWVKTCPFIQMTDTDDTFLFSSNIVGHTHMYVMTFTSSILASLQTLGRVECEVAGAPAPPGPPYLIFSVSSGCMQKFDPEYFLLSSHHRSDLVRAHTS